LYSALLLDNPLPRRHPLTKHTWLYSPAAGHHRPLAVTLCAYPRRDGQAELPGWLVI